VSCRMCSGRPAVASAAFRNSRRCGVRSAAM
jgi:hypothetical protein